jgi:hypothetical protein
MIVRVGDSGTTVGMLQQLLIEAGYSVGAPELASTRFGASMYSAVRSFQAHHVGPTGHPLDEDGIVGPDTLYALQHPNHDPTLRYTAPGWRWEPSAARGAVVPALRAAVGEVGNHEEPDGSNRGPAIDKYGQDGQPWCAFFVSWCYGFVDGGSPFGTIGSAYKLQEWARLNGRLLLGDAGAMPQPGDLFIILRSDFHGHTGLIGGMADDGMSVLSIEGNCSNAVRGMVRPRTSFSSIVRPIAI